MHPFIRPTLFPRLLALWPQGNKKTKNERQKTRVGGKNPNRTERATRGWSQVKWWLGSGCFSRTPPWFAVWSGCRGPGRQWRPPSVNWCVRGCASRPLSPCWRRSECEIVPVGSYWQWALRERREKSKRAENMYTWNDCRRIPSEGRVLHSDVHSDPNIWRSRKGRIMSLLRVSEPLHICTLLNWRYWDTGTIWNDG